MSDIAAVLVAARAVYASAPSHAKCDSLPPRGSFCLCLALDKARDDDYSAHYLLAETIGLDDKWGDYRVPLIQWNAEHSTEEVLAAFDAAIQAAQ